MSLNLWGASEVIYCTLPAEVSVASFCGEQMIK